MNLLFINYYWPPVNNGGVQRILKICKYLVRAGHNVTVITGSVSGLPSEPGLERDAAGIAVVPVKGWLNLAGSGSAGGNGSSPSALGKILNGILTFIWLNVFIPDARVGWYWPVKRALRQLVKARRFDAVISSGPPYTCHLAGMHARRKYGLPWVADIRDPWVENVYYNVSYRFPFVKALHRRMERSVLRYADAVTTVGEGLAEMLAAKVNKDKIKVIYNGFDPDDFEDMPAAGPADAFRLGYYGSLHGQQVPHEFLQALADEVAGNPPFGSGFMLEMFGPVCPEMADAVAEYLPGHARIHDPLPHDRLVREYAVPQVMLLLINRAPRNRLIITGKIFEYLRSGWPVLGFGPPDGDAGRILERTGAGTLFAYERPAEAVGWLVKRFEGWSRNALERCGTVPDVFSRKVQAASFAEVCAGICN